MIDEREFWTLIDRSREAADGDVARQEQELRALLRDRPREDLEAFRRIYETLQVQSYHWDVWAAGYILAGGMSDDSFDDFREWLITRGERVFRLALQDADALADELPAQEEDFEAEGFGWAVMELYEERFGAEMPQFDDVPARGEPGGEEWDEDGDDLQRRFPRLWARAAEA